MPKENKLIERLADIGEKEILNRLQKYMDIGQIDDDTALIRNYSAKDLIINTDLLVEDVHFNEQTLSPKETGWKSVAVNLSDLACSGVEEILGITVGLVVPSSTPWSWVEDAYSGINNALETFGGKLLGGDCSHGKQRMLSITAIGTKGPLDLHRSNARPGDHLVTSGNHGLSRLGLGFLLSDPLIRNIKINESLKKNAIQAHKKPTPPLKALSQLLRCKPYKIPLRAAATDSSDGLLEAINCICKSSNCSAIIDIKNLPMHSQWPKGDAWINWCLEGGEDFELVVSLPPKWAKEWVNLIPQSKVIGKIEEGPPNAFWSTGKKINSSNLGTFKHF